MGLNLNPIFITTPSFLSNEELLKQLDIHHLKKGRAVDFYDTNNQWDTLFIGNKDHCKILCEGGMAKQAFNTTNPFLDFTENEVASIIWNEVSDIFGFSLMKNGVIVRQLMLDAGEVKYNFGQPIPEELAINVNELFDANEKRTILQQQGKEAFLDLLTGEIICTATNNLAKRYLGTGVVDASEDIEFYAYEEV